MTRRHDEFEFAPGDDSPAAVLASASRLTEVRSRLACGAWKHGVWKHDAWKHDFPADDSHLVGQAILRALHVAGMSLDHITEGARGTMTERDGCAAAEKALREAHEQIRAIADALCWSRPGVP